MRPIPVLNPKQIDQCRAAAEVVVKVHQMVVDRLRPGVTPTQLDRWVGETLWEHNAKSCFLGYRVQRSPPSRGKPASAATNVWCTDTHRTMNCHLLKVIWSKSMSVHSKMASLVTPHGPTTLARRTRQIER